MNKKQRLKQLIIITLTLFCLGIYQTAQAAVGLIYFEATLENNGTVSLEWETGTEQGAQGFIIKRQAPGNPAFISLPDIGDAQITDNDGNTAGFVIAQGSPAIGAIYDEVDTPTTTGAYVYKLFEIDDADNEVELATSLITIVDPDAPTPTNTPTASPTSTATPGSIIPPTVPPEDTPNPSNNPTDVPTATNTPAPSNTPTQTNTPIPTVSGNTGNNPTATSTATPRPTNTSTSNTVATNTPTSNVAVTNTPIGETAVPTTTPDNSDTVLAQEPATATPTVEVLGVDPTDEAYPPPTRGDEEAELPLENPITDTENITTDGLGVTVIGAENATNTDQSSELGETSPEATTGRVWLWVGFIIGLLAFVGFAIGAIVIFTRKK